MKWLPMESAPRDGTKILLHDAESCYAAAWLDDSRGRGKKMMRWSIPESWQDEQGGYEIIVSPLGWMPIPEFGKDGKVIP